ncbi:hypothetical protein GVAV_003220 [Gurleya vavrai]
MLFLSYFFLTGFFSIEEINDEFNILQDNLNTLLNKSKSKTADLSLIKTNITIIYSYITPFWNKKHNKVAIKSIHNLKKAKKLLSDFFFLNYKRILIKDDNYDVKNSFDHKNCAIMRNTDKCIFIDGKMYNVKIIFEENSEFSKFKIEKKEHSFFAFFFRFYKKKN